MSYTSARHRFAQFANWIARASGSQWTFMGSVCIVAAWLISGLFIGYDNTLYQLTINTTSSVVTLLMVFIVQNSQNRNAAALHVKLDELIRAVPEARTEIATLSLAEAPEDVIVEAHKTTQDLAQQLAEDA